SLHLERGAGQDPPVAVAQLAGRTYRLKPVGAHWALRGGRAPQEHVARKAPGDGRAPQEPVLAKVPVLGGYRLQDVSRRLGVDFDQSSFAYGMSNDPAAMMGGGVCWLDANGDGRLDLFAVNSYDDPHYADYKQPPRSVLFLNGGKNRFVPGWSTAVRGEGCVAGDLDGDGRTDLVITTASDDVLLWNAGGGRFVQAPRPSGFASFGWHSGAAIADVDGDGRPDLFV